MLYREVNVRFMTKIYKDSILMHFLCNLLKWKNTASKEIARELACKHLLISHGVEFGTLNIKNANFFEQLLSNQFRFVYSHTILNGVSLKQVVPSKAPVFVCDIKEQVFQIDDERTNSSCLWTRGDWIRGTMGKLSPLKPSKLALLTQSLKLMTSRLSR